MRIALRENGLYLDVWVTDDGDVRLMNLSANPGAAHSDSRWFRLVEVQQAGENLDDNCGSKHTGTQPGSLLRYASHTIVGNSFGKKLEITQRWKGLTAVSHLQFYTGLKVVKSWTELQNNDSAQVHPIEYLSSFTLTGMGAGGQDPRDKRHQVWLPHNSWFGEAQWKTYTLGQLGYGAFCEDDGANFSMKRIAVSSTGTWPAGEYLPMGSFVNIHTRSATTWQIETAGSWNWEISDVHGQLYVAVAGPSEQENGFVLLLKPAETFRSVPCAVAFGDSFQDTVRELTRYRRVIRRRNRDNENPSVIFNDYMNCLWGDPTTAKELPLIDAAAEAGCQYYCVDCGWYSDGPWWDGVGEWLPSSARFPGGITEVLDYIRARGMIPGLWLELEVMGIKCPLVPRIPKEWFFQRHGRPILYRSRYQLDFRNPEVIRFADGVVDRLVRDYGVGYIKMDYNINAGLGTDLRADNAGQGLLEHTRGYLKWLDGVFERYPDLVIENCGSGGMRMEYSLLSRLSIQSVTDQTDYLKMAAIAANCAAGVAPEQAAIWSYPLPDGDEEETIFNMVNAMLLRIHQSGHLPRLSPERFALVREGIDCHKSICNQLKDGLPFWPLGLGNMDSPYLAFGMDCGDTLYLAVWNVRGPKQPITLPLPVDTILSAQCLYPQARPVPVIMENNGITVTLDAPTARLFAVRLV